MNVPVRTQRGTFIAGAPQPLFTWPHDLGTSQYTVSRDGKYFMMIESDPNATPTQLQIVLNWAEELKESQRSARP